MTKEEKNLNKLDLYAYRNKEANMYSMVPGNTKYNIVGTQSINKIRDPVDFLLYYKSFLPQLYQNYEDHPIKNQLHDHSKCQLTLRSK